MMNQVRSIFTKSRFIGTMWWNVKNVLVQRINSPYVVLLSIYSDCKYAKLNLSAVSLRRKCQMVLWEDQNNNVTEHQWIGRNQNMLQLLYMVRGVSLCIGGGIRFSLQMVDRICWRFLLLWQKKKINIWYWSFYKTKTNAITIKIHLKIYFYYTRRNFIWTAWGLVVQESYLFT